MATLSPKWLRLAAATIALTLLVSGVFLREAYRRSRSQLSESRCSGHEKFVRSEWMDTTKALGRLAVRGCMIDDLLMQHELRGFTRAEVVALIGEPTTTDLFKEYDLVYWLGPERGLVGTDSEWLVIRLDKQNRVSEAALETG